MKFSFYEEGKQSSHTTAAVHFDINLTCTGRLFITQMQM